MNRPPRAFRLVGRSLARAARTLAFLLVAATAASAARGAEVEIIRSEGAPPYGEAASALQRALGDRAKVVVTAASGVASGHRRSVEPDVVVALGTQALAVALERGGQAPLVAALVPWTAFQRATAGAPTSGHTRPITAVYLDQPFARQLNLIRLTVPDRSRIGVLFTPGSTATPERIEAAARKQKLAIVREEVTSSGELYPSLMRLLAQSSAVLATPDPAIYNASTIHNVLLTTYRARQPLFGFSAAYVRAGALAAVYSTPDQMAREVAGIVAACLRGAPLPPPRYPSAFTVSVNPTVARSLRIVLEPEQTIVEKLTQLERTP